ncbi:MAG TPA: nuclear transport factor 2 family protein [Polyangiaceae bacterium]|nr:nuclear transport factor 2 family protein [Polyangiaceae bacterium]
MTNEAKTVALAYIEGCGRKDWDAVTAALHEHVQFSGPGNAVTGAAPYLAVLQRIAPVWVRSEVKSVLSGDSEVCVLYDFVTDTPAGAVPIVEWLGVEEGKIKSVKLLFDRVAFKPASDELARRARG